MLFDHIPENLFSILASANKKLYIEALFVLRKAFKIELVIRRTDLIAMLIDSLETSIRQADFTEEGEDLQEDVGDISGKAHLLLRRLRETGWLEIEYEKNSYDENVTVPDYAIKIINLLFDLSIDERKEYNSYVFATYSALKNTEENQDYLYQALSTAYRNTVQLLDELKSLFNNIKRYHMKITDELGVNDLLEEHFDVYKEKIIDQVYYPLKTIDSVPRFKNSIIMILNEWVLKESPMQEIIAQGIRSRIYVNEEQGREDVLTKINYIVEAYENIDELISNIDHKHMDYTNVSIDKIRYLLNSDRSIKGKLVYFLKRTEQGKVIRLLTDYVEFYQHTYVDEQSMYPKMKRSKKKEGQPMKIAVYKKDERQMDDFLKDVRKQYGTKRIDDFIVQKFGDGKMFTTADVKIEVSEEFILFMLGTIRGTEKGARYKVIFKEHVVECNGYRLPFVIFQRKEGK